MRIRTKTTRKLPTALDQIRLIRHVSQRQLFKRGAGHNRGATIIEYVILVAVIGLSITFVLVIFEPQSKQFHDSSTTGRQTSYPTNFIREPTPTVAATATPG